MAKMARIQNGVVAEIMIPIDGFALEECFHPSILAQCVSVEDDVEAGWVVSEDGIVPPPEPEPEPKAPPTE